MKRFALMLIALGAFGFAGCKKDEATTEESAESAAKPAEGEAAVEGADTEAADEATADEATADEADPAAADPAAVDPAADPAAEAAAAEGETQTTGVAECDQLIEKYTACVSEKAPENVREQTLTAFQANVDAWQESAKDESAKETLAEGCAQTTEQLKKSSADWGCEW